MLAGVQSLAEVAFVLGVAETVDAALAMPIHVLVERSVAAKKKERHQASIAATTNLLLYSANRGEKGKRLKLEDFLPWQEETPFSPFRGLMSASELMDWEEILDSPIIGGVKELEIRLLLGFLHAS
jgi:hypothetical protein